MKKIYERFLSMLSLCLLLASCSSDDLVNSSYQGKRVLWVGTSIPWGCSYPKAACKALQLELINRSVGSSFVCIRSSEDPIANYTGYSLSMTKKEKEQLYLPWVQEGKITQSQYDEWLYTSYETLIMEKIKNVDIVVFDHGYNDHLEEEYRRGEAAVDWTSEDRTTFIGAFNYLYNRMLAANPKVKVIIGGYWQNQCSCQPRGERVAAVSQWIAKHYNLPLLDAWNRVGVMDGYAPNSANYLDSINAIYGTTFTKIDPDDDGNITYYQQFCPDGVHPFSDPTGHSDAVLDEVITQLLRESLSSSYGVYYTSE